MEKNARKYAVIFTVEETEPRRLTIKMNAIPFLRTSHCLLIAESIMEHLARNTNVPIETVLADFCNVTLARNESVRMVEQRNIPKGD